MCNTCAREHDACVKTTFFCTCLSAHLCHSCNFCVHSVLLESSYLFFFCLGPKQYETTGPKTIWSKFYCAIFARRQCDWKCLGITMTGVSSLLAERFTRFLISQGFQRWLRRLLFVCAWMVRASETIGRKLANLLSLRIIQQSIVRLAGFHILMHVHFATSKLYWCWSWHHKGAPVEGSSSSGTLLVTLWLWFAEVVEFASTVFSAR